MSRLSPALEGKDCRVLKVPKRRMRGNPAVGSKMRMILSLWRAFYKGK